MTKVSTTSSVNSNRDSLLKIVEAYFAAVCVVPFSFNGRRFTPLPLEVSPSLFRELVCPPMCGGCCRRFTLVWLPTENKPEAASTVEVRTEEFNGVRKMFLCDWQNDHSDYYCRHLRREDGRCGIHTRHPFSCDFELLRFHHFKQKNVLGHRLFGRGWNMKRIDGERGARCYFQEMPPGYIDELARRLQRLKQWCEYCGIYHRVDRILQYVRSGPHQEKLVI